jgi:hypothetical protein
VGFIGNDRSCSLISILLYYYDIQFFWLLVYIAGAEQYHHLLFLARVLSVLGGSWA